MNRYRTHTCGELQTEDAGLEVRVSGWLSAKRDHGGIFFIHLRDFYGVTQVVLQTPEITEEGIDRVRRLPMETVLSIEGKVRLRPEGMENPNMKTGGIEIVACKVEVLSVATGPTPFPLDEDVEIKEEMRLMYRYLDLRRDKMRKMIIERDRFCQCIRQSFQKRGFIEVHTPVLSNSSPEGSRDFLVPSRLHPGKFFALPQAPQQWKQLLIAGRVDRYFQIAPCFRDEPARADRTPGEFYQIDIEMAFVEQEDVLGEVEEIIVEIGNNFCDKKIITPFPRMSYQEALDRFGSDKPDLRFGFEMLTLTEHFGDSRVRYIRDTVVRGDDIRGLVVPRGTKFTRRDLDNFEKLAKESGVAGLAWVFWTQQGPKGTLAGPMPDEELRKLRNICSAKEGSLVLICAGRRKRIDTALSAVRLKIGKQLGLRDPNTLLFAWITDFPMYELDEQTGEVVFCHNPFSMPQGGLEALNTLDPLDIKGQQYDLTCNGVEISSGAIRNNNPEALYRAFEIAGYTRDVVDEKFGHMIKAFQFGSPPHGGIAPGLERLLMFFTSEESIREVIPFPKNQKCQDVMINAPGTVSETQLRELNIKLS